MFKPVSFPTTNWKIRKLEDLIKIAVLDSCKLELIHREAVFNGSYSDELRDALCGILNKFDITTGAVLRLYYRSHEITSSQQITIPLPINLPSNQVPSRSIKPLVFLNLISELLTFTYLLARHRNEEAKYFHNMDASERSVILGTISRIRIIVQSLIRCLNTYNRATLV
jgi:hypothetical protein